MTQPKPDLDEVTLRADILGADIGRWTSYTFASDFLTPCDGFQFSIGDPDIPQGLSGLIAPGIKVSLNISGRPICTGYIAEVAYSADRSSGTVLEVSGRDILGDVVDSCVDPFQSFQPTQTLEEIAKAVLSKFNITEIEFDAIAGQKAKDSQGHIAKPYPAEGAYEFIERLAKRQGLHLWAKADGTGVVLGKPNFKQESSYKLTRRRGIANGAGNNIVSGHVKRSMLNQPSVIVASARAGGGDFAHATVRCIYVNPLISIGADGKTVLPSVQEIIDRFPSAYKIKASDLDGVPPTSANTPYGFARPLYWVDSEAKTLAQLIQGTKREMAKHMSTSLEVVYEVAGHTQDGKVWTVDTVVDVEDEVGGLNEPMWISGVTFKKSRSAGTTTELKLMRLYTLAF